MSYGRITRVQAADNLLRESGSPSLRKDASRDLIAAAQVHATLALAEQQRIANVLYVHTHGGDGHLAEAEREALGL